MTDVLRRWDTAVPEHYVLTSVWVWRWDGRSDSPPEERREERKRDAWKGGGKERRERKVDEGLAMVP